MLRPHLRATLVMQRLTWHCSQKFFCFSCFLWTFLQVVWVSLQFSTGTTYYFLYSPPKLSSKRIFCTERAIPCGFLDGFVDGFPDSQLDSWIIASRNPGFLDSQCSEIDSVTLLPVAVRFAAPALVQELGALEQPEGGHRTPFLGFLKNLPILEDFYFVGWI